MDSISAVLKSEQEGNMPIEDLLAMYRYEASDSTGAGSSIDSSSVELSDDLPDMTLDKVINFILFGLYT